MKVVVTGSSGYVGMAVVDRLVAPANCEVVGVDRTAPVRTPAQGFTFVQCDLSSPGGRLDRKLFDGVDTVIHLAAARGDWAISADEYWRDNNLATQGLLAASWARRVSHWVFMSSVSVYGPADTPLTEDSPCNPTGPYGQSKLASELLFREFVDVHGMRGCVIRPSAVFSPGHPRNTNVYKLIESMRGAPLPLIGGGRNRKTVTYLPNLVDLIAWCIEAMRSGQQGCATYNYVEEPVQTMRELIATLKGAGIRPSCSVPVPLSMALAAAYPIYGVARLIRTDLFVTPERVRKYAASTWYDSSRVRRVGFTPNVGLIEALQATARWHIDNL